VGDDHLLDLVVQHLLDEAAQALHLGLGLLEGGALLLGLLDLEVLLGGAQQLVALRTDGRAGGVGAKG
jgi:hypothetical protein